MMNNASTPELDQESPFLWETVGRRKGHRLTLAPAVEEVRRSSASPVHNSVLVSSQDEDTFHECIMAGYSSEEAIQFIETNKKAIQLHEAHLKEQFWSEVGFPNGSRWWELESQSSSVGSMLGHTLGDPLASPLP
jgi:hypothetical protein